MTLNETRPELIGETEVRTFGITCICWLNELSFSDEEYAKFRQSIVAAETVGQIFSVMQKIIMAYLIRCGVVTPASPAPVELTSDEIMRQITSTTETLSRQVSLLGLLDSPSIVSPIATTNEVLKLRCQLHELADTFARKAGYGFHLDK